MKEKWSEASVGRAITHSVFQRAVLSIPCCGWTGHEADLLVVEKHGLRLIDVEVKISRSDLKADIKKDKWWMRRTWSRSQALPLRREWPPKIWKHYYALPQEIWTDDLFDTIPPSSGVILLMKEFPKAQPTVRIIRRAKPSRDAQKLTSAEVLDLARLAGLRMWEALARSQDLQPTQELKP